VTVRAPLRVDLTGGYTDCEPFASTLTSYAISVTTKLFAVIECAPSHAHCSVELQDASGVEYAVSQPTAERLASEPGIGGLVGRALVFFGRGAHVRIRIDAPLGSGLGTSGAITVAITRAMLELSGSHAVHEDSIPHLAAAFERVAGHAGGLQDQLASVTRGFGAYRFDRGRISAVRFASVPSMLNGAMLAFPPAEQRRLGSGNLVSLVTESWRHGSRPTRQAIRRLANASNSLFAILAEQTVDEGAARAEIAEILFLQRSLHPEIRRGIDETPIWPFARQGQVVGKPLGGAGRGAAWVVLRPFPRDLPSRLSREGWSAKPLRPDHARSAGHRAGTHPQRGADGRRRAGG
jgi:D-glycero-alpha-D-manno-heptose-7-phosphate kinase